MEIFFFFFFTSAAKIVVTLIKVKINLINLFIDPKKSREVGFRNFVEKVCGKKNYCGIFFFFFFTSQQKPEAKIKKYPNAREFSEKFRILFQEFSASPVNISELKMKIFDPKFPRILGIETPKTERR